MEDVHHDTHEVQESPPSRAHALGMMCMTTAPLDCLLHSLGERPDVGIGRPGRNDEKIGCVADRPQIQYDDIVRLVIVERAENQAKLPDRVACYALGSDAVVNGSPVSSSVGSSI